MDRTEWEVLRRPDAMDLSNNNSMNPTNLLSQFTQVGIPAFVMSTFGPSIQAKLAKHPKLMRFLSIFLTLYLTLSVGSSVIMGWLPRFWGNLMSYGMSHVDVSSQDGTLNRDVTTWLASKRLVMVERFQSARSSFYLRQQQRNMGYSPSRRRRRNTWDSNSDEGDDSETGIVFTPKNDLQILWHNRRMYIFTMSNSMRESFGNGVPMTIWCFGWSPAPIQNLLLEIQTTQRKEENVLTQILTPQSGCGSNWVEQTLKRARPLDSVYLEPTQKAKLLEDMQEYLDGETREWYQDRGIPYRRGYLFHGAPGCGKSSLALALAGHFKLKVYIVSLTANGLTDYNLSYLFQALQPGCLVLLEDVDSAGLVREGMQTPAGRKRQAALKKNGKKIRKHREDGWDDKYTRHRDVTLSGLLNAIDGPGSPEGHILVMTTNCPDELDDALTRAGRVDVKVEFKLANKEQIREIFYSLFKVFPPKTKSEPTKNESRAEDAAQKQKIEAELAEQETQRREQEAETANNEIAALADRFADLVPNEEFSPAQLQDYILLHKNQPQRAVDEVETWIKEHNEEKARLDAEELSDEEEEEEVSETNSESGEESAGPKTPMDSESMGVVVVRPDGTRGKLDVGGRKERMVDLGGVKIDQSWVEAIKKIAEQMGLQGEKMGRIEGESDGGEKGPVKEEGEGEGKVGVIVEGDAAA
jgi:mitochondrial chaperone BCS1